MLFNQVDYELFDDYRDLMMAAFQISCSWCGDHQISYVRKGHPPTIGNLLNSWPRNLSDAELDQRLVEPIAAWQNFDDANCANQQPTYLCDECYNAFSS